MARAGAHIYYNFLIGFLYNFSLGFEKRENEPIVNIGWRVICIDYTRATTVKAERFMRYDSSGGI